ncbi:hypothetical protein HEP74_01355 [Xanthomonas sp. SS]|nr:hypothetical protein HEP75_01394 [Xanthomonas sp. SI]QNH16230.1 hypothetical protein HEP74_01355 [Xanthomonas sp. SS]
MRADGGNEGRAGLGFDNERDIAAGGLIAYGDSQHSSCGGCWNDGGQAACASGDHFGNHAIEANDVLRRRCAEAQPSQRDPVTGAALARREIEDGERTRWQALDAGNVPQGIIVIARCIARFIGDRDQPPVGVIDIGSSQCRFAPHEQGDEPSNAQPDATRNAEINDGNAEKRIEPTGTSYDAVLRNVHILWPHLLLRTVEHQHVGQIAWPSMPSVGSSLASIFFA